MYNQKLYFKKCPVFALVILITVLNISYAQESARDIFERAVEYHNQNSFDEAIAEFSKVIEIDSEYSEAYYNRGGSCFSGSIQHGTMKSVLIIYEEKMRNMDPGGAGRGDTASSFTL